jgi:3-oxoacyl-[acyl-carrier protein] reductase
VNSQVTASRRVAVVTGGAQGIGAATAVRLARAGFLVVVCDINGELALKVVKGIIDTGGDAAGLSCDVSQRLSVVGAFGEVVGRYQRVDALVTCAGMTRDNLIHKMTDSDWDAVIDTHLKGTFLCAQAAQRYMVPQRYGKMVFISSPSARNGQRGQTNYSAAKAGIEAIARTLAIELGPFNINVNAVAPGFVDTGMTRAAADRMGIDFEEMKRQRAETTPLRRIAKASDIAATINFLCSEEASYITGQIVYVRGGP